MEGIIIGWIKIALEFLGMSPGGALIALGIAIFIFWDHRDTKNKLKSQDDHLEKQDGKINKVFDLTRAVEREQADQHRRMETHADHFTVLRNDMDRNLDIANNANSLSIKVVSMIVSAIKKKDS